MSLVRGGHTVEKHTFFLSSERHYILSVLVLHGFLLQVFEQTLSVERSCSVLIRLVFLT